MTLAELLEALERARRTGDPHAARSARGALRAATAAAPTIDPLLAAALRPEIEDPAVLARLDAAIASAAPRCAETNGLVVDTTGQGHRVRLLVALVPGDGAVWTPTISSRDVSLAAQVAVAAALGPEAPRWGVRWQLLQAPEVQLTGSSLGFAIALATIAARRGLPIPTDLALTGGLDLGGRLVSVTGVPAKLRAAAAAGLLRVALPAGDTLRPPPGLEVLPFQALSEAVDHLLPRPSPPPAPKSPPPWGLAPLLLVWICTLVGAFAPIDLVWGDLLRGLLLPERPTLATIVLPIPPEIEPSSLRSTWPARIDALAAAGARAVVFDLAFASAQPGDPELAQALFRAPIPVVLAARSRGGHLQRPASPELARLPHGLVTVEHDLLTGKVRRAPAFLLPSDGPPIWHLSIEALRAARHDESPPQIADEWLVVGLSSIPLSRGRLRLGHIAAPPHLPWDGPWEAASGRIVLIGAIDHPADQHRTPAGPRQGVEVMANLIDTLAANVAPRPVPLAIQGLLQTLLLGLAAWKGPDYPLRMTLICLVSLLAAQILLVLGERELEGAGVVAGLALLYALQRKGILILPRRRISRPS